MPFLAAEIAAAQVAVAEAQQRAVIAAESVVLAQGELATLRDQLAAQEAQAAQLAATREAVSAQATAVATLLQQAQNELTGARAARALAQQRLDDHLLAEPEPPEGEDGRPPTPAEIAMWRRAHAAWEAKIPALEKAVSDADAAIAAATGRVIELSQQHSALAAQLGNVQASLNDALRAVDAMLAHAAALEARLPMLEQGRDITAAAVAPAQAEVVVLTGLATAVARDPFERPELERAAAELGTRLRGLQADRAWTAAEGARRRAVAQALHDDETATRTTLAGVSAELPGLHDAATAAENTAIAAQAAVGPAEMAEKKAIADIRKHKNNKPKRNPGNPKDPGYEPFDMTLLEEWQAALGALAAAQTLAIEQLVAAREASAAAASGRNAAWAAYAAAQQTAAELAAYAAALKHDADAADEGAALMQTVVDRLDPRIAELREARESATARLLGDVGCDRRLVLAPVRLETRFVHDDAGHALLIRIYPDDWFVDTHEPELTADERTWGLDYHEQVASASGDAVAERRAWDQLAARFGPQRAAWIAGVLDPAAPHSAGERAGSWTRAPHTALLPDRWVAIGRARDDRHAFCAWSRPIAADPLPVGLTPGADPLGGEDARWLTEFGAAVDAGMALRVPLAAEHAAGLGRLVVLGVRTGLTDAETTGRLAAALDAHHYTGGLAVLPPGTPSNTTASGNSGYTRGDPDGTRGYATERGAALATAGDGSDGSLIAAALGVDAGVLAHVAGADGRSRARAAAMHAALWGVVGGPLHSALSTAAGAEAVRAQLAAVRAGGPLPVLRVGFQPYGIVPATSLQRWVAEADDAPEALASALRALVATWRLAADRVPRATPGMPLDALLAEHAYSLRFAVPTANGGPPLVIEPGVQPGGAGDGPLTVDYVALLRGADPATTDNETFPEWPDARSGPRPHPLLYLLLRAAVLSAGDGRVAAALDDLVGATAGELRAALLEALDTASHRVDAWVTSLATARMERLAPGAVHLGAYGWLEDLRPAASPTPVPAADGRPPVVERADNYGHVLAPSLAHATTAAILRSGYMSHRDDPGSPLAIDLSSRRVGMADWIVRGVRTGQPLAALLGYRFERLVAETGLQRYLHPLRTLAGLRGEDDLGRAGAEMRLLEKGVDELQDDLEPLTTAWEQAKAVHARAVTRHGKVAKLRDDSETEKAALDKLVGVANDADKALEQADARVAAHKRPTPKLVTTGEVDNEGKPIKDIELVEPGVLAEWQLEHDELRAAQRQAADAARTAREAEVAARPRRAELDALITALNDKGNPHGVPAALAAAAAADDAVTRTRQDLTGKELEVAAAEEQLKDAREAFKTLLDRQWAVARESVAATNVVDGLELHRRYRAGRADGRWDATTIPFADEALGFGGDARNALAPALADLADAVDAVGDLVVAESVHQIVLGNPLRSGATLDAVARGEVPPPELEIVRTPRRGIGVTHRVVVLLDAAATSPAWGADAASARAAAAPQLNAWLSRLLPDPARVACRVELRDPEDGELLDARELRVGALGLAPLDIAHATARGNPGGLSELEQRIALHAMATRPSSVRADAQPRVLIGRDPGWPATVLSVADLLHCAGAVQRMVVQARGLDPSDFGSATAGEPGQPADPAIQAATEVRDALDGADLDGLRTALVAAAGFGVAGALPASLGGAAPSDREILLTQARSVRDELSTRIDRATAAGGTPERLTALFGDAFLVAGPFPAPGLAELFGGGDNDRLAGGEHLDAAGWLQRAAHVRPGLRRLSDALAAAETLDAGDRMRLQVGQLPVRPRDRWVALPPAPGFPLQAGRVSIVAHVPRDGGAGTTACGLLIDEWVEVVPNATEIAGAMFHFDQAAARAPQAILVAVAPDRRPERRPSTWDLDTLEDVVQETWRLAWARIVDPALLREQDPALTGIVLDDAIELARAAQPAS